MPVATRQQQHQNKDFKQIVQSDVYNSLDDNLKRYLTNDEHDRLLHEKNSRECAEKEAYENYKKIKNKANEASSAYNQYNTDKNNNANKILTSLIKSTKSLLRKKSISYENIQRLKLRLDILNCKDGVDIIEIIEHNKLFKKYELPYDGVLYRIPPDEWHDIILITNDEVNILASAMDPSRTNEKYIQLYEDKQNKQWVDVGALWWDRPKDWLK